MIRGKSELGNVLVPREFFAIGWRYAMKNNMNSNEQLLRKGVCALLQRTSLKNVVVLIAIVGLICGSNFYKISANDIDSTLPSLSGDNIRNDTPSEMTTSTGIELILVPSGEYTVSYRKYKGVEIPDDIDPRGDLVSSAMAAAAGLIPKSPSNPVRVIFKTESCRVVISEPFYLGKYPVTQRQWKEIMGNNPSRYGGNPDNPVENVSWDDANEFIRRINSLESTDRYRLPTSAQWEHAMRAGTETAYFWGDEISDVGKYVWFAGNSGGGTHPVGMKLPNRWKLHDMMGNVYEWVEDTFDPEYRRYAKSVTTEPVVVDPIEPAHPEERIHMLRGGAWSAQILGTMTTVGRGDAVPEGGKFGFRIALSVD